jgi:hypothetical protein
LAFLKEVGIRESGVGSRQVNGKNERSRDVERS